MLRLPPERVDQSGEEAAFAFPRDAVTALSASQPGIEQVSDGVAEHVERVDGKRQAKTGPERQPGALLHVPASFPAEHPSPIRNVGWQAVAEEAQGSQSHNHPPELPNFQKLN